MSQNDIERAILSDLYDVSSFNAEGINFEEMCMKWGWDSISFRNIVQRMTDDGLIRPQGGGRLKLTSHGILRAEREGLAPEESVERNNQARELILETLAKVYEEKGAYHLTFIDHIPRYTGLDERTSTDSIILLINLGFVERSGNAGVKILYRGLDYVKDYRERKALVDEFARISELMPQPRGRALQRLIAKIVEQHGWSQEEGVRASHEEMDVIVYKEREYYLLESKWEKDPVEAGVVRELYGKLGNRADVRGIITSMSGFTGGAEQQVKDYVGDKVIVLFGPDDIRSMVNGKATFEELLNAKYKALVTRRQVLFD